MKTAHWRLTIGVLVVAAGCSKPAVEEVQTTAAAPVKALAVTAAPFEGVVAASGLVSAAPGADWVITAPEPARIVELPKAEGDHVKPGDLLVRFEIPARTTDVAARRAEVDQAKARVENAQASVTRLTTLVEHGVAAQKELEDAKRDLSEARAALAQAEADIEAAAVLAARSVVRARFAGVIAKRGHNPGDMVDAASTDLILRVIDPSKLQVIASVPIPDLVRVQVGRPVRVLVPGADDPEEGKVLTRPAAVDPTGVSADVRISFNAGTKLAVGTPVRVEIVAEQRAAALAVPVEAVIREEEESFVMVAGADSKAHKRKVTIGLTTPKQVEITGGLKAGEMVIVQGQQGLPDGAAITQEKMSLASLVDRYGRAIVTVTVVLAAAGLLTAFSLPSDIYPPLIFPRVVVIGHSGTMPARSMMLIVTRPIEQALLEVPGIRRVRSTTFRGATEISAQFDPATDMILALQQAQGKVAEIRGSLPVDLDLAIERLTPSAFPILSVNLTGGSLQPADLYDYAFYVMRPALSRVPGVGNVEVLASDTREIEVIADPARLTASGLTIGDVADALQAANTLQPVGRYNAGGLHHLVLASGMWKNIQDIPATPLVVKGGATIRVSDVATVQQGAPDRTSLISGDGAVAANISVSQQVGANILDVRAGVETALADLSKTLPSGLKLSKTYDLAEFVATAIANVRDAILIGSVLAVIVLLVFLRDWRLTLVASVTLPLTVMTTFVVMRWLGETINVMSMGGLAVAIGLVIDDAVVVVENIYRHLDKGEKPGEAVQLAMTELIAPVVGSTMTTVVVFVPLGMLSGVIGQFFRALSITLASAVLISLVQALTLIPLLAQWAAKSREQHAGTAAHEHKGGLLERVYSRTLDATMQRPILGIVIALMLAAGGGLLFMRLGSGFLPAADEGGFVIDYNAPPGTALPEIDRVVLHMEAVLKQTPEIAAFTRRTGSELGLFATQQTKGDILVRLKPAGSRKPAEEIISDLRDKLAEAAPGYEIEFVQLLQDMLGDLEGAPNPIEVKVFGDDPDTLAEISEQIEGEIEKVSGIVDLVGVQRGNPETTWDIDATAIGRLGLNVTQVSEQLSDAWLGDVRTELRLPDRTIPVRVRYPDAYRLDPQRMAETPVRAQDGRSIPLGSLAHATTTGGELILERENLRQMATVSGHLENRDLGGAVAEIQAKLAGLKLPVGYTTEVGGQYASQRQAFRELLIVFAIAAALVFIILVVQFRRFLPAVLILLAAPLSLGGAFALLLVTGTDLNVSSAMGLILLVGLVVKNGIVLLDYAHRLRDEGTPFTEALETAGRVRLRPILMTTLCTLFGLLPLALGLGAGAELQRPLALAVIGGLTLSTFVTLYLVPLAYRALSRTA